MFRDLLQLFFPGYCIGCQKLLTQGEKLICISCLYALPQTDYHKIIDNVMARKFYGRVQITYAMSFCKYRKGSIIQKLIHALKYDNQPQIGNLLGGYYRKILSQVSFLYPFQRIIPVPLHANKLSQRGYNQSEYFAKGLGRVLKIPWNDACIQRIKLTSSQIGQSKISRLQNLCNAFHVKDQEWIRGKHILLVDDIITTGATLEACATVLLEARAQHVSIATIGIAQ